jgi:hypothetical protein
MSGNADDAGRSPAALDPRRIFGALAGAEVDYVLVGGFAVAAHGAPRATADLDICPDPDEPNLARLADLLEEIDARSLDADTFDPGELPPHDLKGLRGGGNFRLMTRLGKLDVMQYLPPFDERTWDTLSRHADMRDVFGLRIRVCGYDDLIAMKRVSRRPQDEIDINSLKAARREL